MSTKSASLATHNRLSALQSLALAFSLASITSGAAAQGGPVPIMAPIGMYSCGDYMGARRSEDGAQMKAYWAVVWSWGYMSRYNRESPAARISIPEQSETMHLYFEKFCRENPLSNLMSATDKLVYELGGNPLKSWPMKK